MRRGLGIPYKGHTKEYAREYRRVMLIESGKNSKKYRSRSEIGAALLSEGFEPWSKEYKSEYGKRVRLAVNNSPEKEERLKKTRERARRWREKHPERYEEIKRNGAKRETERLNQNPHKRERRRETERAARLKLKYGLEIGEYERRISEQGGVCAICGAKDVGRSLAVDHDHLSGKVRKLLCLRCNQALGLARENVEILERMVRYLVEHGQGKMKEE